MGAGLFRRSVSGEDEHAATGRRLGDVVEGEVSSPAFEVEVRLEVVGNMVEEIRLARGVLDVLLPAVPLRPSSTSRSC